MNSSVHLALAREFEKHSVVSLARFMELALYDPLHGYYRRRDQTPFGMAGDFYTAVQVQPVFGEIVDAYVARAAEDLGFPETMRVVDLGAGREGLASSLPRWNYCPVDWESQSMPEQLTGIVIANEFFDALPIHLLQRHGQHWRELLVARMAGGFGFVPCKDVAPGLLEYAGRYGGAVPASGLLEVSLDAHHWVRVVAQSLSAGRLLVIDYGYSTGELARFPSGTLLSYRRHSACTDVLSEPGRRDITAFVNFTALKDEAAHAGLQLLKECSLGSWILDVWEPEVLAARLKMADRRWKLLWKQLVFGMGESFRVLEFEKAR